MDHRQQRRANLHQRRAHLQVHQVHVAKPHPTPIVKRAEETCLPGQRHCRDTNPSPTVHIGDDHKEDWWTIFYPTVEDPTPTGGSLTLPTPTVSVGTPRISTSSAPSSSSSSSSPATVTRPSTTLSRSTAVEVVTQTAPSASAVNAAASNSASAAPTGATQTGSIIGGIGGGLIGVALICALVSFFFGRWRKRKENKDSFNSADFRRSAVLLQDPPNHADTVSAGFNSRLPPPMAERRPATFGTIYGAFASPDHQQSAVTPTRDQFYQYQTTSAHPLYTAPQQPSPAFKPYTSPNSPLISSPIAETPVARSPSSATSLLTRQSSKKTMDTLATTAEGPAQYAAYPSSSLQVSLPTSDYVDLSRSSVSPFQAAQYAEISMHIGSEPPSGLSTPAVQAHLDKAVPPLPVKDRSSTLSTSTKSTTKSRPASLDTIKASPAVGISPFQDPVLAQVGASRFSAASSMDEYDDEGQVLEFPAPPAPVATTTTITRRPTHTRVDSKPPILPEITVNVDRASRSSFATSLGLSPFSSSTFVQQQAQDFPSSAVSSSFPNSVPASPGTPAQFITVTAKNSTFPVTPSPLNASFTVHSPSESDMVATTASASAPFKRETVYDPDDVYGGI